MVKYRTSLGSQTHLLLVIDYGGQSVKKKNHITSHLMLRHKKAVRRLDYTSIRILIWTSHTDDILLIEYGG